ncbi:MAG: glycosyltransferase family 2 protein, partial [Patulibacter sp.]
AGQSADGDADRWPPAISVVIAAGGEPALLPGVLAPLAGAPGVVEVIVVDERSDDAVGAIVRDYGAVTAGGDRPPRGWSSTPWALQQGLVASRGEIVVFLDPAVRPDPALPAAVTELLAPQRDIERQLRAEAAPARGETADFGDAAPARVQRPVDLASAQLAVGRVGVAARLLGPALRASFAYRLGPLTTLDRMPASLAAINGQCFAARRDALISAGGFALVSSAAASDVALARALAAAGWRIAIGDGTDLGVATDCDASARNALREPAAARFALSGAASRPRQLLDLGVVWVMQARPALALWRMLAVAAYRRSPRAGLRELRPRTVVLLAVRWGVQLGISRAYRLAAGGRLPDPVAFAAPLADPVAFAALVRGTFDARLRSRCARVRGLTRS